MHSAIEIRRDQKRGCGWRKGGGLYLISDCLGAPCGKLPIPLEVCPCCGGGIKPTRAWTWINGTQLAEGKTCALRAVEEFVDCSGCPLSKPMGRVGLLWVGGKFYKTPQIFAEEANAQGVSRRIPAVPREFKLGETWVWLAHRECIPNPDGTFTAGVFRAFKPQRIEYVTRGDETAEEIDKLVERGITPIKVERTGDQGEPIFASAEDDQ